MTNPADGSPVVFVHAHYPDIWAEMACLLAERLTMPFRLVVTTSGPPEAIALPRTPVMLSGHVLRTENRGRDILPFLRALAATEDFTIGLKLHTKRSPQRLDGAEWRGTMLDDLLPPGGGAEDIVRRMRDDPRIGLVAPTGFSLSVAPWMLVNEPGMRRFLSSVGHDMTEDDLRDTYFAAGSMFWFRRSALAAMAVSAAFDVFEPEGEQLDGTAAHAAERLFPVVARRAGTVSLDRAALLVSRPGMTDAELASAAREHADRPSTFFPGLGLRELPPGTPLPVAASARPAEALAVPRDSLAPARAIWRAVVPLGLRRTMGRWLHRWRGR